MPNSFRGIFGALPTELVERLEKHYYEIKQNFACSRFEPAELNGGKFCEIVLRILEWHANNGKYTPLGEPIKDFGTATRRFESNTGVDDSVRFHIPQIMNALYPIRSKRGVAHHSGEINPNLMDAAFVVSSADWIMAELVRLFHKVSVDEARSIVESLITKQVPLIWQIGNYHRVISPPDRKLDAREKVLLLLYNTHPKPVTVTDLLTWTEYDPRNKSRFRNTILKGLHKEDLAHFDQTSDEVHLSPLGISYVEANLPLRF